MKDTLQILGWNQKKLCLGMIFCLAFSLLQAQTFNVRDFGATGQKSDLQTTFIQAAIDQAYQNGGGKVYLPPGDYLSGTLILKSNVTFHLEAGATLYASRNIDDYRLPLEHCPAPTLLYANGAENFSICGKGTLHGQAEREWRDLEETDAFIAGETELARKAGVEMKMYYKIPPVNYLLLVTRCKGLTIEGVSFIESSFWTMNLLNSERIRIHGIYVHTSLESGVNADGIDINASRDVIISDSEIITGDDAIVLKSWGAHEFDTENITVSNCILSSSSTALKIGTETYGNFRHILFNNCVIKNSNRGLSIVVRYGGHVSDVIFSNITIECNRRHFNWWGSADPIWLVVMKRNENTPLGSIENVVFENILAHGRGTSRLESRVGKEIRNVTMRNVQFFMQEEDAPDKRATDCLAMQNVDGLTLDNVQVHWDALKTEPKWGSALHFENVSNLKINRFSGRQGLIDSEFPVIRMENVQNALLENSFPASGAKTLLEISGNETQNLIIRHNDPFKLATQLYQIKGEIPQKSTFQLQD
ncbi:MAG: right-handed parallel beta-helix repeat-containing protein [Bacteroidia bacterium]|nr:right-handed parallel beta-helix repeat-containing protein [Bacteroidia bacterium]